MHINGNRNTRLVGLAAIALGIALVSPLAAGQGEPARAATAALAATTTVEPEAPDFASEAYGDPWDYANVGDQNTDLATAPNINVSGGSLNMDLIQGSSFDPVAAIPGALGWGRDGSQLPINTARYKRLSFSLTTNFDRNEVGALYWFSCSAASPSCEGGITFAVKPGTNLYDLDLTGASTIGGNVPWSGSSIVGLRFIPAISLVAGSTKHVSFDWMRLYAPSANSPHGNLPPGVYNGFTIDPLPEVVIDSPNPQEGRSIAQAQLGHEWDFTNYANVAGVGVNNAIVNAYDSRGMTATNANSSGDPQVALPISAFDGATYHNLTFDLSYDGPFSLIDGAGGGKLARVIWTTASSGGSPQDSNDIVTYSGTNQMPISVDLNRADVLDENSRNPRLGWGGQTITALRFDPNEDVGSNTWHLKNIAFRADPAAVGQTTVRFHDAAWVPGTTATVLVGTASPGGTGYTAIASNVTVTSGINSVPFPLGARADGSYHVEVILQHPSGTAALGYSRVPITMSQDHTRDPRGNFEATQRAPGGAQVAGWAFDPDVNTPIQVVAYVDGTAASVFATSVARPDVQAIFPNAPAASGFSTVVPMGSGVHTLCLYGLNVGAGANALINCRQVSVSTSPTGSLDAASAQPGGLTAASGWALDPDTAAPITVHIYVDGSLNQVIQANGDRPDIAAAFPGYGASHGFSTSLSLLPGPHQVCLYGINVGLGSNSLMGCKSVLVPSGSPVAVFEALNAGPGSQTVSGWALDPDTADSISVHLYVDGTFQRPLTADGQRPDVAAAFPGYGARHGVSATLNLSPGLHSVCLYGINVGLGGNTLIGCRSITISAGSPIGSVDAVSGTAASISVAGWTLDPDTASPVTVHAYLDGVFSTAITANGSRPDIAAAYPAWGALHGFSAAFPALAGAHSVCLYALSIGNGNNTLLGCQAVTVPAATAASPTP